MPLVYASGTLWWLEWSPGLGKDNLMIDEDMLMGMAATYCAKHGMADSVGASFGEWLVDTYEGSEWEDLGSWRDEWELYCIHADVSVFDGRPISELLA